ncbi:MULTISPECIES: hypothetical protein [Streptomyces]|uniref:hypothetical protein n=1 Tax=Streptomyces TaxID=1883 RepID=UPI00201CBBFE|nr:hypothetical protein [Streptomyces panaciradicis]MCL6672586.1 hypothetical protein [Streptomyces panaciradicis]
MSADLLLLAAGLYAISFLRVDAGYLPFLGGLVLAGLGIGVSGAVGTTAITGSLGRTPVYPNAARGGRPPRRGSARHQERGTL